MSGTSELLITTDDEGNTVPLWPVDADGCISERADELAAEAAAVAGPEPTAHGGDA